MRARRATRARRASTGALAAACGGTLLSIVLAGTSGCREDVPLETRRSQRHETCQVTNDCAEGLSCAPLPGGTLGVCVTGSFSVRPTARECVLLECTVASDCCDPSLASFCERARLQCETDSGISPQQSCRDYQSACGCATGKTTCVAGKCVSRCTKDVDCTSTGLGRVCTAGRCQRCVVKEDCSDGLECVNGDCTAPCSHDGQCAGFDRCVQGRCLPSGCQTDRECVAATRNVDARCTIDGKCNIPCESDLECGDPTSYTFFSCIDKLCTYVGCDSDKDCRLFYTGVSDASVLPQGQQVVCRDKATVGDITKPAQ